MDSTSVLILQSAAVGASLHSFSTFFLSSDLCWSASFCKSWLSCGQVCISGCLFYCFDSLR